MPPKRKSQSPKRTDPPSYYAGVRVEWMHKEWIAAEEKARIANEKLAHLMGITEDILLDDVAKCCRCDIPDHLYKGRVDREADVFYCRWCAKDSSSEAEDSSSSS